MEKTQRTWALDEVTILSLKALAAIFQKTDSQVLENIINVMCVRVLRIYDQAGFILLPTSTDDNIKHSGQNARKTVALSQEVYEQLKKITELSHQKESGIVESFVRMKVPGVFSLYPYINDLIHAVLKLKEMTPDEVIDPKLVNLYELYTGEIAPKEKERLSKDIGYLQRLKQDI